MLSVNQHVQPQVLVFPIAKGLLSYIACVLLFVAVIVDSSEDGLVVVQVSGTIQDKVSR